jgi:hypothetical protein
MQNKVVVPGKVEKDKTNQKRHKIKAHKSNEADLTIELTGEGEYEVEKLSVDGLPTAMTDGNPIRWLNNFHIKKNGQHIKERFLVTIPNIESSRLVIYDSNGIPYYYTGEIKNNTFELTDGDPAVGRAP